MNQPTKKRTYLILRLSALGDVAMTLPYVYHVARNNPEDTILFITQPFMGQLLIDPPNNLKVLPFDKKRHKGIHQLVRFALDIHKHHSDAFIIDLHQVLRTKLLITIWKALGHPATALQKPRKARRKLLSQRVEAEVPSELYIPRMTELYKETLRKSPLNISDHVDFIIPKGKQKEGIHIGLAPYAQHRGKMISKAQTVKLISRLRELIPSSNIILYGAPGEETIQNQAVVDSFNSQHIQTTQSKGLAEEVREITQLSLMVSMDSANQHIAAMVGTPVVSIWGATHPAAGFIPFQGKEADCLGIDINCRPCSIYGNKECKRGDWACLERLDIDSIAQLIADKLLESTNE